MTGSNPTASGPTGVLFDLDGVLWDTSPLHEKAFARVCADEGLEPVPYSQLAGRTTTAAWTLVLTQNGRTPAKDLVDRLTLAKQGLARGWLRAAPPLSPSIAVVRSLERADLGLGLVTGSSPGTVSIFLEASGITFDVVISGESSIASKPNPDPYLAAADVLGIHARQCWVLEDSIQGLESATSAGARTVHLTSEGSACVRRHPSTEGCVSTIEAFVQLAGVKVAA
jgi:HAD superfamily hydrolase (TIGR01509 family)